MRPPYYVTAHARERWAERVGRGCILRSLRRAQPPGPEMLARVATSRFFCADVLALFDRKRSAVFICRDQDGRRNVLTVITVPQKWEE